MVKEGWLKKQLISATEDVKKWPPWMRNVESDLGKSDRVETKQATPSRRTAKREPHSESGE